MKKGVLLVVLLIIFPRCATLQKIQQKDLIGIFCTPEYCTLTLELRENNTFKIVRNGPCTVSECEGIWKYIRDSLLLECSCFEQNNIQELLSSAYMQQRKFKFRVKNKNELVLDDRIIFERRNLPNNKLMKKRKLN